MVETFSGSPFIRITDEFPTENLTIPSISVESREVNPEPWELGNYIQKVNRIWDIDVFAKSIPQRDEISYVILNALEPGVPVYDYDEGFPPDVSPSLIGRLNPLDIKITPVRVMPELVEKLYYRTTVQFIAEYSYL
jgi:hypothetical protein